MQGSIGWEELLLQPCNVIHVGLIRIRNASDRLLCMEEHADKTVLSHPVYGILRATREQMG
jgi:hypothetical protein